MQADAQVVPPSAQTNNINNGTINNITNITYHVQNAENAIALLQNDQSQKQAFTDEEIKLVRPMLDLLERGGMKKYRDVVAMMEFIAASAQEVLTKICNDGHSLSSDIYEIMGDGCDLHYKEDKQGVSYIDLPPRDVLATLAKKVWLKYYLPNFDESLDAYDQTIGNIVKRSVRKNQNTEYCEVLKRVDATNDGKLFTEKDKNAFYEKYYDEVGVDRQYKAEDGDDEETFRQQNLKLRAQNKFEREKVFKYSRWTREKWDTTITTALIDISDAILKEIHNNNQTIPNVLRKCLKNLADRYFVKDDPSDDEVFLTVPEKIKKELEAKLINDSKNQLIAGWQFISNYIEANSKQHRDIAASVAPNSSFYDGLNAKNKSQVELHF